MLQKFNKIEKDTYLNEVYIVEPSVHTQDFDGEKASQIYTLHSTLLGIPVPTFIEDKVSVSKRGVLKGFHGDRHTWKLLTCLSGKVALCVVSLWKDFPTYLKSCVYLLDAKHPRSIIIPPGFINAHLNLEDSVLYYKLSEHYRGPEEQVTVNPLDPEIAPAWSQWINPKNILLTRRDKNGIPAREVNW